MRTIPVPLLVGAVIGFLGTFAVAVVSRMMVDDPGHIDWLLRCSSFNYGCWVVELLLTAIGLFAVAGRSFGMARTLVTAAAWAIVAMLVWALAQFLVIGVLGHHRDDIRDYAGYASSLAIIGTMIVLAIAARAFTRPSWVTAMAVLGVLFAIVGSSTPVIGKLVGEWLGKSDLAQLYWLLRDGVLACAMLAMVHGILRDAPPATPDPALASRAFRIASVALLVRIFAAIALALFGIGLVRSGTGIKWVLVFGPAITAVTAIVFAWAMLDAERAAIPDLPRVRLVFGAAMLVWSAAVQVLQADSSIRGDRAFGFDRSEHWTLVGPVLAIAGPLLVVSAIHAFAARRGDDVLRASATSRGWLFAILAVAPILLPYAMMGVPGAGSLIGFGLIAVVCAVFSIVVLAGLMGQVAGAFGDAPRLPEARLRR